MAVLTYPGWFGGFLRGVECVDSWRCGFFAWFRITAIFAWALVPGAIAFQGIGASWTSSGESIVLKNIEARCLWKVPSIP
jgi:hypothetical protein